MEEQRPGFQLAVKLGRVEIAIFLVTLLVKLVAHPEWMSWWIVCMPLWIPILGSILVAFYYKMRGKHNPFVPRDLEDMNE